MCRSGQKCSVSSPMWAPFGQFHAWEQLRRSELGKLGKCLEELTRITNTQYGRFIGQNRFLAEFGSMGDIQNTHVHKITYIVLCWLVSEGIKLQICADQYNDICIPQYFWVSNLPPWIVCMQIVVFNSWLQFNWTGHHLRQLPRWLLDMWGWISEEEA